MTGSIPQRIQWAATLLAVKGADELLEIGCGRGAAVALIGPSLTKGHMLAIDRSATAIAAARKLNRESEAVGKVSFRTIELSALDQAAGRFDKIFAINVNLFWTGPGTSLIAVKTLLKERGRLYLFYEPPVAAQREGIEEKVRANLAGSGLSVRKTLEKDMNGCALLCVEVGREAARVQAT